MTSWKQLQSSQLLRPHKSSRQELEGLFAVAERSLKDASVTALSDDGRFLMAYTAAYQLSTIALHASGYQAHGDDHHKVTFSALPVAMGGQFTLTSDYFDRCRKKRNNLQYDNANVTSTSEAEELLKRVERFREELIDWLRGKHAHLLPAKVL